MAWYWSHTIFRDLLLKSALFLNRIDMQTRSVCAFFLTWVGSYENHCFGIHAHTFIFQVGHPIYWCRHSVKCWCRLANLLWCWKSHAAIKTSETNSPVARTFHTHLNTEDQGREEGKERSCKHFTRMQIDKIAIGGKISILDSFEFHSGRSSPGTYWILIAWVSRTQVCYVYKTR